MSTAYVEAQPATSIIIKIPLAQVHQNFPIPNNVNTFINYTVWNEIIQARRTSALSANCSACLIEWILCLFVIPLIPFLFHPCLALCFNEMAVRGSMASINSRHYDGRRVVSMDLWFLYVNSAELPASFVIEQGGAHPVVVMQPTTYGNYNTLNIAPTQAQAAPVYTTAEYGGYSKTDASANVAIAGSSAAYAPVAQRVEVVSDNYDRNKNGSSRPSGVAENLNNTVVAPFAPARKMRITIPAGALPGQTITAISPDGVSVSVSIPSSVSPGQSVLVNY